MKEVHFLLDEIFKENEFAGCDSLALIASRIRSVNTSQTRVARCQVLGNDLLLDFRGSKVFRDARVIIPKEDLPDFLKAKLLERLK